MKKSSRPKIGDLITDKFNNYNLGIFVSISIINGYEYCKVFWFQLGGWSWKYHKDYFYNNIFLYEQNH